MSIIIGRKHELEELDRLYRSDRPEFLAVYGRRRVGKTYNQFPILVSLLKMLSNVSRTVAALLYVAVMMEIFIIRQILLLLFSCQTSAETMYE